MSLSYTWNKKYILPLESIWSVKEKFCVLNAVNYTSFNDARKKYNCFQVPSNNCIEEKLKRYSDKKRIYICPVCIKHGYHSWIHQKTIFNHCYVHTNTKLEETRYFYMPTYFRTGLHYSYADFDLSVEDIVSNDELRNEINLAINRMEKLNFKYRLFKFDSDKRDDNICSQALNLILNKDFGIESNDTGEMIYAIRKDEIFSNSSQYLKNMYYQAFQFQRKLFNIQNISADEYIKAAKTCSPYNRELGLHTSIRQDTSPIIIRNIISEFISKYCGSLEKYIVYTDELKHPRDLSNRARKRYYSHRFIYSRILTIYTMVNSADSLYFKDLINGWHPRHDSFYAPSIDVPTVIDQVNKVFFVHVDWNEYISSECITDIICRDIFELISSQILVRIESKRIDIMKDSILSEELILDFPQYIVTEEENKIKIYRMLPDKTRSDKEY